jgi:hypothetical protein
MKAVADFIDSLNQTGLIFKVLFLRSIFMIKKFISVLLYRQCHARLGDTLYI